MKESKRIEYQAQARAGSQSDWLFWGKRCATVSEIANHLVQHNNKNLEFRIIQIETRIIEQEEIIPI